MRVSMPLSGLIVSSVDAGAIQGQCIIGNAFLNVPVNLDESFNIDVAAMFKVMRRWVQKKGHHTIYGELASVLFIPAGSSITLMQAGLPDARARSSAGEILSGSSTSSP